MEILLVGCFIVIGYQFNIEIFCGQFELKDGYIVICLGSNGFVIMIMVFGVFVVGDVQDYVYCQVIMSVVIGCMVVLDV